MGNGILYGVTVLIWGSTWLAIEYQLGVVAPEVSVFYRYVGAAGLLFAWCLARGLTLKFDRQAHSRFIVLGLLLFGLNYILAYHAQEHLSSALMAIGFSTMLWMNIGNARLFFGVRAGRQVIAGALTGIAGIVILFMPEVRTVSLDDAVFYGASLCLMSALIASLGNMASQTAQKEGLPIVQSNAWGMLYGSLLTGGIAFGQGKAFAFDWSFGYVSSLLYLTVFGTIIAFGAYLTLLGRIGAHKAGYAVVMFPVVALLLSFLFEGLQVTPNVVAGIALVLMGNIFVLRSRKPPQALPPPAAAGLNPPCDQPRHARR